MAVEESELEFPASLPPSSDHVPAISHERPSLLLVEGVAATGGLPGMPVLVHSLRFSRAQAESVSQAHFGWRWGSVL